MVVGAVEGNLLTAIFVLHDGLPETAQVLASTALPVRRVALPLGDMVNEVFRVNQLRVSAIVLHKLGRP